MYLVETQSNFLRISHYLATTAGMYHSVQARCTTPPPLMGVAAGSGWPLLPAAGSSKTSGNETQQS